jgi:hypothetical protein
MLLHAVPVPGVVPPPYLQPTVRSAGVVCYTVARQATGDWRYYSAVLESEVRGVQGLVL